MAGFFVVRFDEPRGRLIELNVPELLDEGLLENQEARDIGKKGYLTLCALAFARSQTSEELMDNLVKLCSGCQPPTGQALVANGYRREHFEKAALLRRFSPNLFNRKNQELFING